MNDWPRRRRVDLWSPEETAINNALQEVEKMGADPLLTMATVLLSEAQERVVDFIDQEIGKKL